MTPASSGTEHSRKFPYPVGIRSLSLAPGVPGPAFILTNKRGSAAGFLGIPGVLVLPPGKGVVPTCWGAMAFPFFFLFFLLSTLVHPGSSEPVMVNVAGGGGAGADASVDTGVGAVG